MDNYISVINKILELSNSIGEAVRYIQNNLEAQEEGVIDIVLDDTIDAMKSIDKAIKPILKMLGDKKLKNLASALYKKLNLLHKSVVSNKSLEIVNFEVIPAYIEWESEIQNSLRRLTYS